MLSDVIEGLFVRKYTSHKLGETSSNQSYFVAQSQFVGLRTSPKVSKELKLKEKILPCPFESYNILTAIQTPPFKKPFMLTHHTGQCLYRDVERL